MSRNGSGTYTFPTSSWSPAVTGVTMGEDDWNTLIADLATAVTASIAGDGQTTTSAVIPFASGIKADTVAENSSNTGVTVDGVLVKDGRVDTAKSGDTASDATTDIGAMAGNYGDITGTTTITALGTIAAGRVRVVQFDGALTLTHNATSLILPSGSNITTAAGDVAGFVSEGSGNWRCVFYTKASGVSVVADIVTDTTPQLGGDLDVNGQDIVSASDGDINIVPNGTGKVNLQDKQLQRAFMIDYGETVNAIGAVGGGSQDIDLTLGNVVSATIDTSETTFTFSNPPASGTEGGFKLYLTNGGSQTLNWPAAVDWGGGAAPALTASGVDILVFTTIDGGTTWYGFVAGQNMG